MPEEWVAVFNPTGMCTRVHEYGLEWMDFIKNLLAISYSFLLLYIAFIKFIMFKTLFEKFLFYIY